MGTLPLRYGPKKRGKTRELISEEDEWDPRAAPPAGAHMLYVRVAGGEVALRRRVKAAGGKWRPQPQVWAWRYDQVVTLGLTGRIVAEGKSIYG